jgi:hypothetical protein
MGSLPPRLEELRRPPHSVTEPARKRLLRGLWKHYEGRGLILKGTPISLPARCPRACECWNSLERPKAPGPQFGIQVPWIGPRYDETKVLVLAINMGGSNWRGSLTQWYVARDVLSFYRQGEPGDFGGRFWDGVTRAVHAVLASLDGSDPRCSPTRAQRADALDACAILEAVKCQTDRSPPQAMWDNCPPQLELRAEIELFDPQVLLVFGVPQRASLRESGMPGPWADGPFGRVPSKLNGRPLPAFCLYHPNAHVTGGWEDVVLKRLLRTLHRSPLGRI